MEADFDRYANDYDSLLTDSIKSSGYETSYFDDRKVREIHRRVGNKFKESFNFLNFG
jgi:hypothetical protein